MIQFLIQNSTNIIIIILLFFFRGENDRETLTKVQKGEMTFDISAFLQISDEAKDFIAKLLQFRVGFFTKDFMRVHSQSLLSIW